MIAEAGSLWCYFFNKYLAFNVSNISFMNKICYLNAVYIDQVDSSVYWMKLAVYNSGPQISLNIGGFIIIYVVYIVMLFIIHALVLLL